MDSQATFVHLRLRGCLSCQGSELVVFLIGFPFKTCQGGGVKCPGGSGEPGADEADHHQRPGLDASKGKDALRWGLVKRIQCGWKKGWVWKAHGGKVVEPEPFGIFQVERACVKENILRRWSMWIGTVQQAKPPDGRHLGECFRARCLSTTRTSTCTAARPPAICCRRATGKSQAACFDGQISGTIQCLLLMF